MGGRSGPGVWSGPRKSPDPVHGVCTGKPLSFGELLVRSLRISRMRFCAGLLFNAAVVLLAGSLFAQDSVPASTPIPPSFSASSAPPPIDLKPDASGVVAPEQTRELLRRAEENDVENDRRARDYTHVEREERHHLDGH